jgi:excisionase family DNA binding protein
VSRPARPAGVDTASSLTAYRPLLSPFACEADSRTMSPPTRENTPHLDAGSRYGPTPAAADGHRPPQHPPGSSHGHPPPIPAPTPTPSRPPAPRRCSTWPAPPPALATLAEVLTAREAAAILRVGRNQLYQAITRGQLRAVRIGRSIRIPKHALLDLLAAASPRPSSGDD